MASPLEEPPNKKNFGEIIDIVIGITRELEAKSDTLPWSTYAADLQALQVSFDSAHGEDQLNQAGDSGT